MRWKRMALGCAILSVASCAHVNRKDLDAQLGTLRSDLVQRMDEGDAALGRRVELTEAGLAALRVDLDALERDFGVKVEALEDALRFDVPVHFGFDEAVVPTPGREILVRFSGVASTYYPDARITVEGFTDPAGSVAYNLKLGVRRAEAVKGYLVGQGLSAERIGVVSYGESRDRLVAEGAEGPGTNGWENRRVVLVIDHVGLGAAPPIAEER
ncbi:MAG: OmpA family protein [Longimicrobiales bacterium]|nr:OmpA family protein [Longimicrobiales bacterium]